MASLTGSNAINLVKRSVEFKEIHIALIVVDQPSSPLLNEKLNIPILLIEKRDGESKTSHELRILSELDKFNIEWILLCGYMSILSKKFLTHFYDFKTGVYRVINIHPSLLPKYKGKYAYRDAYEGEESYSGISLHFVNEFIDEGKILLQMKLPKNHNESLDDFISRGKKIEWELYPMALKWLEDLC